MALAIAVDVLLFQYQFDFSSEFFSVARDGTVVHSVNFYSYNVRGLKESREEDAFFIADPSKYPGFKIPFGTCNLVIFSSSTQKCVLLRFGFGNLTGVVIIPQPFLPHQLA